MEIQFKNRPNTEHRINGKIVWESRSAAVVAVILGKWKGDTYVLMEKRSPIMDQPGKWCVPCGYMDWDESGIEAVIREVFEETSFYIPDLKHRLKSDNKGQPFFINTDPSENRQNIAITYGMVFDFNDVGLPKYVTEYSNSEISSVLWIKLNEVNYLDVAFNHDKRILQAEEHFSKYLLPWWKRLIKRIFS